MSDLPVPCCDYRDHGNPEAPCLCDEHPQSDMHPNGAQPQIEVSGRGITTASTTMVQRVSDICWWNVQRALDNFPTERITRADVVMAMLQTPNGIAPMAMVYVEVPGVVIGTTMALTSNPIEPPRLATQEIADQVVQAMIGEVRAAKARIASEAQQPMPPTDGNHIDLSSLRKR